MLTKPELKRYSRHLLLPEVQLAGQERLKRAAVLMVGAGGLGSPVILYLAAAGVGKIGVVDFDEVDLSNLQRQIIYTNDDVGKSKTATAAARATALNPEINIVSHERKLSAENAIAIMTDYDLVIDGTDNFSTRYLLNDACVLTGKPNVYGSIYRFEGQASVFAHAGGPCYRCLYPDPPPQDAVPNCAEGGVLGVIAGLIGCIQATEALKIILGQGDTLSGKLLLYDALAMRFDALPIEKNIDCPICSKNPRIVSLAETTTACATPTDQGDELTPRDLQKLIAEKSVKLLDVRTNEEVALSRLAGAAHIPLQQLPQRLPELDHSDDWVVYCKSGMRSAKAVEMLRQHGFKSVRNLAGGIKAWAQEIDQTLDVY